MSSFSCPHYDVNRDWCERIGDLCVPGRPGCVLYQNSVFAVPWQERLEEKRRLAEESSKDDLLDQDGR
jgi:hypothetical protein